MGILLLDVDGYPFIPYGEDDEEGEWMDEDEYGEVGDEGDSSLTRKTRSIIRSTRSNVDRLQME